MRLDQNLGPLGPAVRPLHPRPRRAGAADRLPAVPAHVRSTNQFLTGEYRQRVLGARARHAARGLEPHAHRAEREANTTQPLPALRARAGRSWATSTSRGVPRFGPQTSADVQLHAGRLLAARATRPGAAAATCSRRARSSSTTSRTSSTRPSASASTPSPTSSRSCATARCASSGLTPEGDFRRHWPYTLFGALPAGRVARSERLTLSAGLRLEHQTLPRTRGAATRP